MKKVVSLKFIITILIILAICIIPLSGCTDSNYIEPAIVKNVILLIGDGMGPTHIEATKIYTDIDTLNMETLPYRGEVSTNSLSFLIPTDSAASGSAMATGQKYSNYSLSHKDGHDIKSVTEYAMENGKKTGIVVTKPLTDATPAAFSVHTSSRYNSDIATKQMNCGIDVMIGEGRDIYDSNATSLEEKGYDYLNTKAELDATESNKIFGIFDSLTPECDSSLAYLSDKAIKTLNKNNDKGFFLMIEGSKIDSMSHDNNFSAMTEELVAFDEAVKVAMDFAKEDKNTMVIVTADHETGDLRLPEYPTHDNLINDCYHSGGHTNKNVLYFSYGGFSPEMPDAIENTDIFVYIMSSMNIAIE